MSSKSGMHFIFIALITLDQPHLKYNLRRYAVRWHPTPVLLPGKSHGWRSLVGCSPWGRKESDTTKRFHFHFSLSCTEEGNGNPLQCSCLENPRDGEAWWAAIYGVAQSWTRLKWLSSSSSSHLMNNLQVSLKGCSSLEWLLCQVIRLCKVRIATDTGPRE